MYLSWSSMGCGVPDPQPPPKVCTGLLEKLNEFQSHAPLVSALRNPGLRERHCATLSQKLD